MSQLDPEFLAILRCPLSRQPLVQMDQSLVSTDPETRRRYRIEDGFPVLLIEEGETLSEQEWRQLMEAAGRGDLLQA
ncbi:MAG: hypothetical protein DWQ01_06130 [Planctomycetota bacterium]|nr:MAG: hypothetical protein DWQ01_06130 [Planctomycetota bacterium]